MRRHDPSGGVRDPVSMTPPGHVVAYCPASGLLHRDAFLLGHLSQGSLLIFGKSQSHRHEEMVSH